VRFEYEEDCVTVFCGGTPPSSLKMGSAVCSESSVNFVRLQGVAA
jgi:hypothetical protein